MAEIIETAEAAVRELKTMEDDDLYRLLAMRVKAIERDPSKAGVFALTVRPDELGIAPVDLVAFGKTAFTRVATAGAALICGADAQQGQHLQRLLATLNTDVTRLTAVVATLLVGQLAIAPAVATVVATIVIGKVAPNSVDALCRAWIKKAGSRPA